jgi:tRNA(Arg) A34 adenosine deaminase TadA
MFKSFMDIALEEARGAVERGEVPVGAVVVDAKGHVLAKAGNETRAQQDPSAHAEMLAIRRACAVLGQERLNGCDLYVTLEPCAMCAGVIAAARLRRVYFAASDPKSGGVLQGARVFEHAQSHHRPEVIEGLCEEEAKVLLKNFFATIRQR